MIADLAKLAISTPLLWGFMTASDAISSAGKWEGVPPQFCTSMPYPNNPGAGFAVCFTRGVNRDVTVFCMTDEVMASLHRVEWCGRVPAGVPMRGRAMPSVP